MKQILGRELLNETIWSNTYTALKCLIDNCYYSQLIMPSSRPTHTEDSLGCDLGYLNEFCTVRMCSSRGSGHTTSMCKLAKEYFDKVIFLSPNHDMSERLNDCFQNLHSSRIEKSSRHKDEIVTQSGHYLFGSHNSLNNFRGMDCEAVFIDGTFMLNTISKENEIYSTLAPCMKKYPQRFFIFIQ